MKDYKEWNIHELDVVDIPQVQFKVKEMVKANGWKWVVPKSTKTAAQCIDRSHADCNGKILWHKYEDVYILKSFTPCNHGELCAQAE